MILQKLLLKLLQVLLLMKRNLFLMLKKLATQAQAQLKVNMKNKDMKVLCQTAFGHQEMCTTDTTPQERLA
jgi:hypothetical protein